MESSPSSFMNVSRIAAPGNDDIRPLRVHARHFPALVKREGAEQVDHFLQVLCGKDRIAVAAVLVDCLLGDLGKVHDGSGTANGKYRFQAADLPD